VYSHANDDWRNCRDYVRQRLGLPQWHPGDERHEQRTIPPAQIDKWDFDVVKHESDDRGRTEDDLIRIGRARNIWDEASPPDQTEGEEYLCSRALKLTDDLAGSVLRFHPRCPWRNENTGQTDFIPCLIAPFRSLDDDEIVAVHRIRVDQPELWPKTSRRMLGPVHRAAIKLGAATDKLSIGEGLETCIAAQQLGLGTAWALGSVGAISFFPVIEGVAELTILAEAGEPSNRATSICGRRWRHAGRRVFVSRSKIGSDHNDLLMAEAGK
jgi:hypothetical protein